MEDNELILRAREVARAALSADFRYDGSPMLEHAEGVARIVADEIGLPAECSAAVFLHEAQRFHPETDISDFPDDILKIVDGLNKIARIKPKDTALEAERYKKLIVEYSTDPRVTVLKIADRLEVMRHLSFFPKMARDQKILETLMLYIPLAHQLGLYNIKGELENIYFRYAEPEQFRTITNKLKATEKDRERLMNEFIEPLEKKLSDAGIVYKLKMRTKTAYSIYRKMRVQNVPFEGVFDVFAIRFIIDCEDDRKTEQDLCWKVYSYVTEEYEPDTSRLRDWLTNPKPNGYESLHITVHNSRGNALEVQIRTKRMDAEAENGQAAHWAYKGVKHEAALDNWLRSVRYTLEHNIAVKQEDLPQPPSKEIFVFTPTGELRVLPEGASVLDFAFEIHTGLGCRCTGAKIGSKAVSIKDKLKTGDVVEIMTGRNQRPSRDWLGWVITSKARNKIRTELNEAEKKKAAEGRELLERRLKNWKLEWPDDLQNEFMKKRKYSSVISFMAAIADGEVDVNDIKAYIVESANTVHEEEETERKWDATEGEHTDDILVLSARHVKGLEYKMAACCHPLFGDDVFGFVTRTDGIKIHRMSCPNAARLMEKYPYRIQKVRWQESSVPGNFQCALSVTASMEHSVLASIMDVIESFKASIRSFNVNENERQGVYDISVRLQVPSNLELNKIISQIGNLKDVIKVRRL